MTTHKVQLKPEHIAIVVAYERLQAALALEAAQLAQVWQQEGAAKELNNLVGRLDSLKLQVVRDAQQLIRVATEIPNGSPPPR